MRTALFWFFAIFSVVAIWSNWKLWIAAGIIWFLVALVWWIMVQVDADAEYTSVFNDEFNPDVYDK